MEQLVNEFTVNVPVDEAWVTLTDLERIAPCLPGAQLEEVHGDVYRGVVKVKVGPILTQFKGEAHFVERDETTHRAVIKAKGRDTGGKGNAEATISAQMTSQGPTSTKVAVTTDLSITGKVAQFGRGAMADISHKLLGQFVENLETTVLAAPAHGAAAAAGAGAATTDAPGEPATATGTATTTAASATAGSTHDAAANGASANGTTASAAAAASGPRRITGPEAEPLDLIDAAGGAMLKRLAPLALVALVVLWLLRRRRA